MKGCFCTLTQSVPASLFVFSALSTCLASDEIMSLNGQRGAEWVTAVAMVL